MVRLIEKHDGLYIEAETKEEQLFFKENSSDLIDYLSYHYKRIVKETHKKNLTHRSDQTPCVQGT
ncbi:hypothetical protein [Mammaliicoccus sp. G-M28]|uniref:hypothetical protein n=1 Tax=Mammaliicoccus sp. G-M28 TaxID=2898688 RepID=UPI001EFA9FB6|nr:hypothetical protein [Mammaliicoccus sp. G-M28]